MRIQKSYLFMGLTLLSIVLFFVTGGPQALRVKETIVVPGDLEDPLASGRTLGIVTLLPRDCIRAIFNPQFIIPAESIGTEQANRSLAFISTGTAVLTPSRF